MVDVDRGNSEHTDSLAASKMPNASKTRTDGSQCIVRSSTRKLCAKERCWDRIEWEGTSARKDIRRVVESTRPFFAAFRGNPTRYVKFTRIPVDRHRWLFMCASSDAMVAPAWFGSNRSEWVLCTCASCYLFCTNEAMGRPNCHRERAPAPRRCAADVAMCLGSSCILCDYCS